MLPKSLYEDIKQLLSVQLNRPIKDFLFTPVSGGSINTCFKIALTDGLSFFCKINNAAAYPNLFLKERNGLQILSKAKAVKVPKTVLYAVAGDYQLLILEWVESGTRNKSFWKDFGQQLALLHCTTAIQFGLAENNFMGSLPQDNTFENDWISFFINKRLQPLVLLCSSYHLLTFSETSLFEKLYTKLPLFFSQAEAPALLHGDLWSGNFMCNHLAQPLLIDPAVYFGHRSVDLGMTTLFGGFDASFYEAYHYHYPLPANHKEQWTICNLYPLLIHLKLFGKGYLSRIQQTLSAFA